MMIGKMAYRYCRSSHRYHLQGYTFPRGYANSQNQELPS